MDANGLTGVLRSRRQGEFTFQGQVICTQPHQVTLEVKRTPSDWVKPAACDVHLAVQQGQFLCAFECHFSQHVACGQIHLQHGVLKAHVAMSALHFEVGREGNGIEGCDLGVARGGEVDNSETRCFGDHAVGPVKAAFVEHVKLRLAERRKGHAGQEKGKGCFH